MGPSDHRHGFEAVIAGQMLPNPVSSSTAAVLSPVSIQRESTCVLVKIAQTCLESSLVFAG